MTNLLERIPTGQMRKPRLQKTERPDPRGCESETVADEHIKAPTEGHIPAAFLPLILWTSVNTGPPTGVSSQGARTAEMANIPGARQTSTAWVQNLEVGLIHTQRPL